MRSWIGRRLLTLAAFALLLTLARPVWAQEPPFEGQITDDNTELRAGGGDIYYIVGHAAKGVVVQVKERFPSWYKIIPPDGIYSYISKAFVDVRGDGKSGVVNQRAKVYAASLVGPGDSYRHQIDLLKGDNVQIVGDEGSYYKIMPPVGAFVYVEVAKIKPAGGPSESPTPPAVVVPAPPPEPQKPSAAADTQVAQLPQTAPAPAPAVAAPTEPPPAVELTPPVAAAEQRFLDAQKLPLEQQPLEELLGVYETLAKDPSLPPADRRVVTTRVGQVRRNIALAEALKNLDQAQGDLKASAAAMTQPAPPPPPINRNYDAVGELIASSVYDGQSLPRLYRLVAPVDGRTVAYVRPNIKAFDPAKTLGRTVGVWGVTQYDPALKMQVIEVQRLDVLHAAETQSK